MGTLGRKTWVKTKEGELDLRKLKGTTLEGDGPKIKLGVPLISFFFNYKNPSKLYFMFSILL